MKTMVKDIFTAIFFGLLLPASLLNAAAAYLHTRQPQAPQETTPETVPRETVEILVRFGETSSPMDLEEYLVGVVLGEMPASFELEALKAQAVAARTYTWKAAQSAGKHGDGSVCTDSQCCQAYVSQEAYLAQGGVQEGLNKIRQVVEDTVGLVLTYEGELIEATYFSCSGGSTEDAAAVWGTAYPYLQAVDSPGEEEAPYDTDTVVYTPQSFLNALGISLTGSPTQWFGQTTYTDGGGVDTLAIGSEVYTGVYLRAALGLRSTAFTLEATDSEICITTHGYGHRVGMSQYGADAMAATGSTYGQILAHYYPGTTLEPLAP